MYLFALGVNHRNADISSREQFSLYFRETSQIMKKLFKDHAVEEAMILSTCNRTELYTVTKCHHAVKEWLRQQEQLNSKPLAAITYEHHNLDMIKHVMSVASGLDSMILGEPQILGQMKQAYHQARDQGTIGQQLERLFQAVFETAKLVRSETGIGYHPVSLTYAVIQLAKKVCPPLNECVVLLLGAGETIELVANYFNQHKVKRLIIANRTLERAHDIARNCQGVPIRFEEIIPSLVEADLIISATASSVPILNHEEMSEIMKIRGQKPLFIADLAVPRDVNPAVGELPFVHLYNIDHLQEIVSENQKSRQEAASQAQAIVEVQAAHYLRQLRVLDAGDMIRAYRQKMEQWRDQELDNALKTLENHQDPIKAMTELARRLTNKFMHQPTSKLRDAAYTEHSGLISLLREIYEL